MCISVSKYRKYLCACIHAGNIIVLPSPSLVSAVGSSAIFSCLITTSENVTDIEWTINGRVLNRTQAITTFTPSNSVTFGTLTLNNIDLSFNSTLIDCLVQFSSGVVMASFQPSRLLVQGKE